MSHDQLRELVIERNEELNKLKLQSLNLGRRIATFARKMDDYERLVMAIATKDVPRVHAIIETAVRNGASVRTMTNLICDTFEGLRHTKGFTEFEHDLGILIYRLGGRSLLYAMNHALHLPSLRTICNSAKFVKITPTIGPISADELRANIGKVLLAPRREAATQYPRSGVTIMMDECAIEEQAVYFSHANQVGGLCQKHSRDIPLTLATHDSALNIVEALGDGKVHFGKEMLFVAVQCGNEKTIYPLLCAPTCKQETWEDFKELFNLVIAVWEESGAKASVGEIFDFASDGDHLRRKAGHAVFMQFELTSGKIFIVLSNLPGLNLFTGPGLMLMTFDWRHIMKRLCTLLRHILGIALDNGRIINPIALNRCLLLIPGKDQASVQRLLNPDDPQNVPIAIELLEAVVSLRTRRLEFDVPTSDVNTNTDLDAIALFSFIADALLNAFTNPEASLSLQIESLSIYAHMLFVLFRNFRLKFMSNQLYGDSQTMVKNIIFTVAKQQELDPSVKVNAYYDGTDPVEGHFGYTRELGGHNSAMNYKQAVERSGWACDIRGVHARNPGLHAGHRRRNITRTEIKDHLNEHNFVGDYVAGHCDLGGSFRRGRIRAMQIFEEFSKLPREAYDIPAILKSKPGLCLMRPHGGNIYPGIADDIDRSIPPEPKKSTAAPSSDAVANASPSNNAVSNPSPSIAPNPISPPAAQPADSDPNNFDDMLPDPTTSTISFEELLQSEETEPSALKLQPRTGVKPDDYLRDENGKFVHKASVCRLVLNKEFVAKSKNRGERAMGAAIKNVRAYTKPNGPRLLNGSLTGNAFINGDLFLTLIRTAVNISLAVVRCTEISVDGARQPDVNIASIKNPKANIKLTGQILRLKMVPSTAEDSGMESIETPSPDSEETAVNPESTSSWLWLGSYLITKSVMKGTTIATDAPHTICVQGHLVEPVSPKAVSAHGRLSPEEMKEINSTGTTWAFNDLFLRALLPELWKRVDDTKMGLREMPSLKNALAGFPYSYSSGFPALLSEDGTKFVTEKSADDPCIYCQEVPANWRGHMGGHIMRRLRKAGEAERDKKDEKHKRVKVYPQIGEPYPCGFCGRSGLAECAVMMKPKGDTFDVQTKCRYAVPFQYQPANKGSATTPSRNVPVICKLCPTPVGRYPTYPGVWRYNMPQHLLEMHSEYASPLQPEGIPLPRVVWRSIEVDKTEEMALGVPEFLVPKPFKKFSAEPEEEGSRGRKRPSAGAGAAKPKQRRRATDN
ncbi:hypothetical protein B0H16DRAFT_1393244 [Mycena metata]|uniref:Uncharacterized protein n=1 Tax=Mycena metata TaxID=1033252 RepID=A0AAD7MAE5_9AGAR|nr:hypothetical protein B0H16DRAFT_1393244 [Mycena metata]